MGPLVAGNRLALSSGSPLLPLGPLQLCDIVVVNPPVDDSILAVLHQSKKSWQLSNGIRLILTIWQKLVGQRLWLFMMTRFLYWWILRWMRLHLNSLHLLHDSDLMELLRPRASFDQLSFSGPQTTYNPDCVFLLETKLRERKNNTIVHKFGFSLFSFVSHIGTRGGLQFLWRPRYSCKYSLLFWMDDKCVCVSWSPSAIFFISFGLWSITLLK